jgi:hypothetical protein
MVDEKPVKTSDKPPKVIKLFYGDFECDVSGKYHVAYQCCLHNEDGSELYGFWVKPQLFKC